MDFKYDTFCGLYCGACDVMLANSSGSVEVLARSWRMATEQLLCHGCKSTVNAVYCVDCEIKSCAVSKGIENCSRCDQFPCARLVAFRHDENPHHSIVLHNLALIAGEGIERWLEQQRRRWACPACGAAYAWYDQACAACGGPVRSCEEDDRDLMAD